MSKWRAGCIPESKRVQAPFGARVQMVQRVQRVVVGAYKLIEGAPS